MPLMRWVCLFLFVICSVRLIASLAKEVGEEGGAVAYGSPSLNFCFSEKMDLERCTPLPLMGTINDISISH